ncbi:methyltransferase domain-containing protein [bacterium]|nr:methyltransferase domain-containing protein [bacterium]
MFWPDSLICQGFYSSDLGLLVKRALRQHARQKLCAQPGDQLIAIGHCQPVLGALAQSETAWLCIPGGQGGVRWPENLQSQGGTNRSVVADEFDLPFPDQSADCLLLMHVLEHTAAPQPMLAECWRVLKPGGRLLALVPNRMGLWAQADETPFGYGRPYSRRQLQRLLHDAQFSVERIDTALHFPPSQRRLLLKMALGLENIGNKGFSLMPGLLVAQGVKTVFATQARPVYSKRSKILGTAQAATA